MCMRANDEEACKLAASVELLNGRVTNLEGEVKEIKTNQTSGFAQMQTAIATLGHDFGERMTLIEKKVVDEKAEWGKVLRKVVLWSAATLLSGAAVAMGVTIWKNFAVG